MSGETKKCRVCGHYVSNDKFSELFEFCHYCSLEMIIAGTVH